MRNWLTIVLLIALLAGSGWLVSQRSAASASVEAAPRAENNEAQATSDAALASVVASLVILALVGGAGVGLATATYFLHRLTVQTQARQAAGSPRSSAAHDSYRGAASPSRSAPRIHGCD